MQDIHHSIALSLVHEVSFWLNICTRSWDGSQGSSIPPMILHTTVVAHLSRLR